MASPTMQPHHLFSTDRPILLNTFLDCPFVYPVGVGMTGCCTRDWSCGATYGSHPGGRVGFGMMANRPCCGFQPMLFPPKGGGILGEDGLGGEGICTLVPHIELVCLEAPLKAFPEFYRCRVYTSFCYWFMNCFMQFPWCVCGVASSHSNSPAGIMSNIGVFTLTFMTAPTSVYLILCLLLLL